MIPEAKLTGAEHKVLAAFRAGDTGVDAAGAEIRGDFLRGLFLGGYDEKADYRGTCIFGAIISDVLNMEFCEAKFPVRFHGCYFSQEIKLQQLICPELGFGDCILKRGLDARMVKVAGGVDLDKVNAIALVCLAGAAIGGQLKCTGGSFQNKGKIAFNARGIKVVATVFLNDKFTTVGAVNLADAEIGEQLDCTGGNFQNEGKFALDAHSIKVGGAAFLCGKFKGEVCFAGAYIGGQLTCKGGNFQNKGGRAFNAQDIKVPGIVFLCDGFKAEGEVSLHGATIGGQLDCAGGVFQNKEGVALNAQGIKVTADVALRDKFSAVGAVWLSGAEIGGQLGCIGGSFQNPKRVALNAPSIKVANEVLLYNTSSDGLVFFSNASIGGTFVLENCKLTNLSLAGANVSSDFRDDVDVYKNEKGGHIVLNIDGFRYQRLSATKERVENRLEWVGSMSNGDKFYPQPYEQLMKVYREMGHMNWARRVGFELERKRHKQCHCMAPSDAEVLLSDDWKIHGKLPKDYPDFNPYYYAVEAALPVLPLGQTENWHPKTPWIRWVQGAITIIGALVLTILASYGVGVLGPRWKDG